MPLDRNYGQWIEKNVIPGYQNVLSIHKRLDLINKSDMIVSNGNSDPLIKYYLDVVVGKKVNNLFIDIHSPLNNELTGFSTQKSLNLLERLIQASRKEGDGRSRSILREWDDSY